MTDLTKRLDEIQERVEQANCMEFQHNPEATVIHDDAPALLAAVRAVLELHRHEFGCGNASHKCNDPEWPGAVCDSADQWCCCGEDWPCSTVRAICDACEEVVGECSTG